MKILESLSDEDFHISEERIAVGREAFTPILDGVWYACHTLQTLKSMLVHDCHFRKMVTVSHFRLVSLWRIPLLLCLKICISDDILLDYILLFFFIFFILNLYLWWHFAWYILHNFLKLIKSVAFVNVNSKDYN